MYCNDKYKYKIVYFKGVFAPPPYIKNRIDDPGLVQSRVDSTTLPNGNTKESKTTNSSRYASHSRTPDLLGTPRDSAQSANANWETFSTTGTRSNTPNVDFSPTPILMHNPTLNMMNRAKSAGDNDEDVKHQPDYFVPPILDDDEDDGDTKSQASVQYFPHYRLSTPILRQELYLKTTPEVRTEISHINYYLFIKTKEHINLYYIKYNPSTEIEPFKIIK